MMMASQGTQRVPHLSRRFIAGKALVLAVLAAGPALAVPMPQQAVQRMQAVANCQPAREYPDLRIRQLEIDNIGTTNAYVICEMMPPFRQQASASTTLTGISMVRLRFFNAGPAPSTIECNLQDSLTGSAPVVSRKAEVVVAPGESGFLTYLPIGELPAPGAVEMSRAGVQCILPPTTSLTNTSVHYTFDADIDY